MAFSLFYPYSYELGMDTEVALYLPQKRGAPVEDRRNDKYKIVYLLHGGSDDHTSYFRKGIAELLVREKDIIVVMPNAHLSMYANSPLGNYANYIYEELPRIIANTYHVSAAPEDTYICGLSMGGMGTVRALANYAENYGGFGIMSAGLLPVNLRTREEIINGINPPTERRGMRNELLYGCKEDYEGSENDLAYQLKKRDAAGGVKGKIYHCMGKQDFGYASAIGLKELMESMTGNWDYTYEEWDGAHNWDFWNVALAKIFYHWGLIDGSELGWVQPIKNVAETRL